ncbi:hypothetical protein [uncultured Intestinimonas sp.]|uniref:hypothetical protein n=1 Tax=uncultured Intestinimonas sp. TaxID=1689265 RepID=UPI0025E61C95|nr:hypothetical protein [uncultured Intestinimonas sp.]
METIHTGAAAVLPVGQLPRLETLATMEEIMDICTQKSQTFGFLTRVKVLHAEVDRNLDMEERSGGKVRSLMLWRLRHRMKFWFSGEVLPV